MTINLKSLHGRLLNLAREQGIELQLLLHRPGAEQFLFRLSHIPEYESFAIFSLQK